MRQRAEEAASASVHHASLSQQYLSLSQKFHAIAEQAAEKNLQHLSQLLQTLEGSREGTSGAVLPFAQAAIAATHRTSHDSVRSVEGSIESQSVPIHERPPEDVCPLHPHSAVLDGLSIPETTDDTEMAALRGVNISPDGSAGKQNRDSAMAGTESPTDFSKTADSSVPRTTKLAKTIDRAVAKPANRPKQRRRLRPRELAQRLRLMAPRLAERIRIRAKAADLKPRQRELSEELRQSRRPALFTSIVASGLLILLASLKLHVEAEILQPPILASFAETAEAVEEELPDEIVLDETGEQQEIPVEAREEPMEEPDPVPPEEPEPAVDPAALPPESTEEMVAETTEPSDVPAMTDSVVTDLQPASEATADLRSAEGRQAALAKYGGSAASESAVGNALKWLAARQRRDGSWDFHDVGTCSHAGTVNNPIGATAYALLPFLAAGQTHQQGEFQRQIQAGLNYLMQAGVRVPAGYDLRGVLNKGDQDDEPNEAYYVHGAATLALCEAYEMTHDKRLRSVAQSAVQFLVNSQDPRGGGWRYLPQQPGSTSVTAIQTMALMAARKAGLDVPDAAFAGISHYLDSVQIDEEGRYGYEVQKKSFTNSVTAMALLCRMYLGSGRDDAGMAAGVELLDRRGPYDNLYYNYFATQVVKNWGGATWDRWNQRLRDDLVAWQDTEGDAAGSWTPRDRADYSNAGGRLLTTCLATLTLEVYYRHKPLLPEPPPE
ncbi:MAG: terpene cyclase/mutase family protein [Planctomycetaceae bacterium]|nr:terpene cyclase/mutase family protein [Planctomycetaceae bacterium]